MECPKCHATLIKAVEDGGMLLRGNAPTLRIKGGKLVIDQKCPQCKRRYTYSPMMIRLTPSQDAPKGA